MVDYIGIKELTLPYKYKELPVDFTREPLIRRDYNFCILCGRCVQMCADVRGIGAISFAKRGFDTVVGTAFDRPLQDSGCRFCGACVEVCPTGALTDTAAAYKPEKDWEEVAVPCKHACPAGINVPLYVYLTGEGKYQEALAIIREKVPFPGTLGRVCIHPCEEACRRERPERTHFHKILKALRGGPRRRRLEGLCPASSPPPVKKWLSSGPGRPG